MVSKFAVLDEKLATKVQLEVAYPHQPRQKCDLLIGGPEEPSWAIETKLLRFLGDNGKPNDNMLMHVISPYDEDRSALTDCTKLKTGGLGERHAVVILGYESDNRPLEPALKAFERLAADRCELGPRITKEALSLVHPVHNHAKLIAWKIN